tara:strand:- start:1299 stop:2468 length:1170 start_codon:yes stop_codon:yes gene_type:complete
MPALQNKTYFNYGGQGPLPSKSLEAIKKSWEIIQDLGPFTNDVWPYMAKEIDSTKNYFSQICGVKKNRIALTENVTSGCVLPLWGLPFLESDRILISDCEHPGVVGACKELARRKKLHIDILRVQKLRNGLDSFSSTNDDLIEELEKRLKPQTKCVVLSHLLWNTGQIMPIDKVAKVLSKHPSHPFLLVDAAQSFGQIPISKIARCADIYAFTGHKWAFGPEGLGGVSVSERVLEESNPTLIGWRSLKEEGSISKFNEKPFHKDARRFEIATTCIPLLAGLRCSLDLLEKEGDEEKRIKNIQNLSFKLWQGLNEIKGIKTILRGQPPAGLVSFSINNEISENVLVNRLGNKKLWIRVLEDPIWLRACLHVTSTEEEIETLLEGIKSSCF